MSLIIHYYRLVSNQAKENWVLCIFFHQLFYYYYVVKATGHFSFTIILTYHR